MSRSIGPFTYDTLPGRVLFGPGYAKDRLAEEVERLGAHRVLLITSKSRRDAAQRLTSAAIGNRLVGAFDQARTHVPLHLAENGRAMAAKLEADCLLSIGGGSATGMAKAIALTTNLPIIAIPTTYAGSEMTPVWGITERAHKQTGRSAVVLPKVVIYDPQLTLAVPPSLSGTSAINALAHCVAGLLSPTIPPVVSIMALEGIRALSSGVVVVVQDPDNLDGRSQTLYGAYLAGSVFTATGSGIHHKLCHILGGAYDLPHAETHTILLPYTTALYRRACPEVMTQIATVLGCADTPIGLFDLGRAVGAPLGLSAIGLKEADLKAATDLCVEAALGDRRVPLDRPTLRELLLQAIHGTAPHA